MDSKKLENIPFPTIISIVINLCLIRLYKLGPINCQQQLWSLPVFMTSPATAVINGLAEYSRYSRYCSLWKLTQNLSSYNPTALTWGKFDNNA